MAQFGCGGVGQVVASNSRGLWFVSSQRQNFTYWTCSYCWKDENKERERGVGNVHFKV